MTPLKTGNAIIEEVNATTLAPGHCAFWWLGQHGFIVKLGEVVIYIDPYLSPSDARNVPPLLHPSEVTNASIIIGTHDHGDHIDRPVWPELAKASPNALFITPNLSRDSVIQELGISADRVAGIDDGLSVGMDGVKVTGVPAAHELLAIDPATGWHECLGVVIEGNEFCLYHAGDTCIYEGIQAKLRPWKFHLALLPINGRDAKRLSSGCIGNMTYQEAVDLTGTLKPGLTIPTHFEMFNGNTEDPSLYMDYLGVKFPDLKALIPTHGEKTIV